MKICGKCGHHNLSVKMKKKKRICEKCDDVMSEEAQCFPAIGIYERDSGGYSIPTTRLSDEASENE